MSRVSAGGSWKMSISAVIPVRGTEDGLGRLVRRLRRIPEVGEILVVEPVGERRAEIDPGCGPGPPPRRLEAPAGRSRQLNRGAREARGDTLWFLHADCLPPVGGGAAIERALAQPGVAAGGFRHALDSPRTLFRWIERVADRRNRILRLVYGDTGLFLRRRLFHEVGGYPEIEFMEDLALSRLLRRSGRIVFLSDPLMASARRFDRTGVLPTLLRSWSVQSLYLLGVPPAKLARIYEGARDRKRGKLEDRARPGAGGPARRPGGRAST
jgi:rSAM/selenodomain-associated transferase 2